MINVEKYLGIPFKIHGRDKHGYDCYGFLIDFEKDAGHEMVDLYSEYEKGNNEKALNENVHNIVYGSKLVKKETPETYDILLFFDSKHRVCHIGAYLDRDEFIHCDSYGVRITKLSTYFRKYEVYGWR